MEPNKKMKLGSDASLSFRGGTVRTENTMGGGGAYQEAGSWILFMQVDKPVKTGGLAGVRKRGGSVLEVQGRVLTICGERVKNGTVQEKLGE